MKIEFNVNQRKALEAVLYLANKAGGKINVYNLLKMLFEADKRHLNEHARPVTGDVYIRMPYGTVPSTIYDFIKLDSLALGSLNLNEYPFKVAGHSLTATRSHESKYLSKSDLKALDLGFEAYASLSFQEVEEKNHKEKCWLETQPSAVIPFEKMIENPEIKAELAELDSLSIVV